MALKGDRDIGIEVKTMTNRHCLPLASSLGLIVDTGNDQAVVCYEFNFYKTMLRDFDYSMPTLNSSTHHETSSSPIFFATVSATSMKAFALALPGSATTVGFPLSASSQILACKGISPRNETLCFKQACVTPSEPKMWVLWSQLGQVNLDMFWIIPRS